MIQDFTITKLPEPPSRSTKPDTFFQDSSIFLDSLIKFREDVNRVLVYLNTTTPNYWICGNLSQPNNLQNLELEDFLIPTPELNSTEFVICVERILITIYESSKNFEKFLNLHNDSLRGRGLVSKSPVRRVNYAMGVIYPPTRTQTPDEFNKSYMEFLEGFIDSMNSAYRTIWYLNFKMYEEVSGGNLKDEEFYDVLSVGSIGDSVIVN